jgi:hypothetical protein
MTEKKKDKRLRNPMHLFFRRFLPLQNLTSAKTKIFWRGELTVRGDPHDLGGEVGEIKQ